MMQLWQITSPPTETELPSSISAKVSPQND
uniref:Uncharacterized protein n=1 Tax=Anguilla anguilla TaxID=7936 RepID=A0A0E9XTL8_ANGAN